MLGYYLPYYLMGVQAPAACLGQRCRLSVKQHHLFWAASLCPSTGTGGSACAREGKATSLLPTVRGISSCALSQQQRNVPRKQMKLRYFVGVKLRYFVGNGSASPSLQVPRLWAPIWMDRMQGSGSTQCLQVHLGFGLSAEALASVPPGLQGERWPGGGHESQQELNQKPPIENQGERHQES